jgi:hypothetical protein
MTEFASTECQKYCGIVHGGVCDVREFGDNVVFVDRNGYRTSETLADVGDDVSYYLTAVQKCPGAEAASGRFGLKKRMEGCNARLGEYSLAQYVVEE